MSTVTYLIVWLSKRICWYACGRSMQRILIYIQRLINCHLIISTDAEFPSFLSTHNWCLPLAVSDLDNDSLCFQLVKFMLSSGLGGEWFCPWSENVWPGVWSNL